MELILTIPMVRDQLERLAAKPDTPSHIAKEIESLIPQLRRRRMEPYKPRLRVKRTTEAQIAAIKRLHAEFPNQSLDWISKKVGVNICIVSRHIHGERADAARASMEANDVRH